MAASSSSRQFFRFLEETPTPEEVAATQNQPQQQQQRRQQPISPPNPVPKRRKRRLPGTPKEDAEVVALSPAELLATHKFVCSECHKGFQREQNLQLHRRGHNLSWQLIRRDPAAGPPRRKVYVCPEPGCVHHDPARALGDLTGIKKHYCRKHGQRRFPCPTCARTYAVLSDVKAHAKNCRRRSYACRCGATFAKRVNLISHRPLCDAFLRSKTHTSSPNISDVIVDNAIIPPPTSESTLSTPPSVGEDVVHENTLSTPPSVGEDVADENTLSIPPSMDIISSSIEASPKASDPTLRSAMPLINNSSLIDDDHGSLNTSSTLNVDDPLSPFTSFTALLASSLSAPSLEESTPLNAFSGHAYDGFKSQQSEEDPEGGNCIATDILSLGKDHPMILTPISSSIVQPPHSTLASSFASKEAPQQDCQSQVPMDSNALPTMGSSIHENGDGNKRMNIFNWVSTHGSQVDHNMINSFGPFVNETSNTLSSSGSLLSSQLAKNDTGIRGNGGGLNIFPSVGHNEGSNLCQANGSNKTLDFLSSNALEASTPFTTLLNTPLVYDQPNDTTNVPPISATGLLEKSLTNKPSSLLSYNLGGTIPKPLLSSFSNIKPTTPIPTSSTLGQPNQCRYIQQCGNSSNGDDGSLATTTLFGVKIFARRTAEADGITRDFLGVGKSFNKNH